MTNEIIGVIVKAVVMVCVALITTYVIPWLKNKVGENNYDLIVEIIKGGVQAAEKKFNIEESAEKKAFVLKYAVEAAEKLNLDIPLDTLDTIIESMVYEVKK